MQDFPSDFQRAMAEIEILVDLGKDSHNVTDMDLDTEELTDLNENGNENSKLGMQDEIGGMEEFTEKSAENGTGVDLADGSGGLQSDRLGTELVEVGNSGELCLESHPVQEVSVKEGDIGYPVKSDHVDNEKEEKGIKEEVKDERVDEGKVADDKKSHQAEEDINTEEKAEVFVENEKSLEEDAEKQTSQEEKETEKLKEVEDDNVEERGSGH